jgi:hypothetical protein
MLFGYTRVYCNVGWIILLSVALSTPEHPDTQHYRYCSLQWVSNAQRCRVNMGVSSRQPTAATRLKMRPHYSYYRKTRRTRRTRRLNVKPANSEGECSVPLSWKSIWLHYGAEVLHNTTIHGFVHFTYKRRHPLEQ